MTIAMADKLVTSFRFMKKRKRKEGLNSVFADFIICRLTETTIPKSRDFWRQCGESVRLLSWIQCSVLHVIDTKVTYELPRSATIHGWQKQQQNNTTALFPAKKTGSAKEMD